MVLIFVASMNVGVDRGSENPSGADNQQETVRSGQDPQRLHARRRDCRSPVSTGVKQSKLKIQSEPHGDMGSQAEMIWPLDKRVPRILGWLNRRVVTKVPKVGMPLCRQRGAAPRIGDNAMSSRLFAGNSVVSSTTRRSRLIQLLCIVAT